MRFGVYFTRPQTGGRPRGWQSLLASAKLQTAHRRIGLGALLHVGSQQLLAASICISIDPSATKNCNRSLSTAEKLQLLLQKASA